MCRDSPHRVVDCYAGEWNRLFSNEQNSEGSNSHIESRRDINADGDELRISLRESEESGPSSLVEEILEFCDGEQIEDLESVAKREGQRRAWLDDRTSHATSIDGVRIYKNPLAAATLYRHLSVLVRDCDHEQRKFYTLTELILAIRATRHARCGQTVDVSPTP
jgi:hypothetical protein